MKALDDTTWFPILWSLYAREEVRTVSGERLERSRRFGLFANRLGRDGRRTLSVLGISMRESQ